MGYGNSETKVFQVVWKRKSVFPDYFLLQCRRYPFILCQFTPCFPFSEKYVMISVASVSANSIEQGKRALVFTNALF